MLTRLNFSRANVRSKTVLKSSRRLGTALALAALSIAGLQAGTASAIPSSAAVQADPGPALWVVSDTDTTIYLFGTFHALDDRTQWFSRNVKAAFEMSDELVLETLVPEDPAELQEILERNSITSKARVGEPVSSDRAPSFVASAGQAMSAGRSMGMSVENGADAVLRRAANRAGKPVAGLESFEFQLRMFRSLPATPTKVATPQAAAELPRMLSNMQSAWKRGDNDSFAAILSNVETQSPATYKILFSNRNANWAGWIADRLEKPGVVFVAVGTGHLIGRDSVQQKLHQRGITSARIS